MTPAETRPATTTVMGDTGLWFVPTGEVLPAGRWSFSLYRVNFDYTEGFTDVSNWPVTFGVGLGDRAELFGAVQAVRRIDRDARPIFFNNQGGGVANEYPLVRDGWSGNQFGDIWIGGKFNLSSQFDQKPVAFGLRGMLKLPTAEDDEEGVGTGKMDFAFDAIVSKEINERVELSGFGGMIFRGSPDDVSISNGFRYGFGVGLPSRKGLRLTAELHGEAYLDDSLEVTPHADRHRRLGRAGADRPRLAVQRLGRPDLAGREGRVRGRRAELAHGDGRPLASSAPFEDETGDSLGFQMRLGYPPRRAHLRAAATAATAADTPPAPQNRPPTATARCEPCTVEVGRTSTVTCDASDPDGDPLTYKWSAPAGKFTSATDRQTPWTAPMQEGPVQVTCSVADGKGGTASAPSRSRSSGRRARRSCSRTCTSTSTATRCGRKRPARWTKRSRPCRRTPTCGSRSKATPATSARPNTTSRSASAARRPCANTSPAAASVPIVCAPSATARSVRSTTTRVKRPGA